MFLLLIGLAIATAILANGTGVFVPAIIVAVLAFWSNGVMANYRGDPQAAPNWAASVSMLMAACTVGLLVTALIIR